ncbi:erythromycin esterase family protein [Ktedonosporobacter rubrisoli]|uniref:Erythromycin esterase family protein n=1 Tax=Ktedonosporobacter rubrisoli TaxID=2509675 RepID=A0A4P6JK24_KTERU|nr:erythromycin esterase family protein [Ktedonosporobacter rubrisoli]QBD75310.1 erythromycin esterase family protein [Ktedonosporobacter rubrisoli]
MTHAAEVYATLDDWIVHETISCSLDARSDFNAAADQVIGASGDSVAVLGFGEALHGGKDLLILRNKLFQRLVEAHGYSAIAIESSFPQGQIVNEYVLGRGPASYEAVQEAGFSHGFGKFEANRELVEWMRRYNADPAQQRKLHFYGFDSPTDMVADSPRQTLHVALDYLSLVDEALAQEYRKRIDPLLGQDAAWENPAATLDPTQAIGRSSEASALRIETEELISQLRVRRPELVARSDESSYQEAVHFAEMARQLLNFHAALAQESEKRQAILLGIRASMMADNLAYIVSREQGSGKVLVFAHNSHLKRGKVQWQLGSEEVNWWPVGSHLHTMYGRRYVAIGSAVVSSPVHGIGQPEAGTLEERFTAAPGPVRFIPTHQGQGLPTAEIATLPLRSGSTNNRSYTESLGPQSFTDFDWFATLDTTAYDKEGWPYLKG